MRGEINSVGNTYGIRVTNLTLGAEHNATLAYAPGLEPHHPIMSKLGNHVGQEEREIEKEYFLTTFF